MNPIGIVTPSLHIKMHFNIILSRLSVLFPSYLRLIFPRKHSELILSSKMRKFAQLFAGAYGCMSAVKCESGLKMVGERTRETK